MQKTGVLLINLGTPDSPSPKDVKRYLKEFLTDPRVIDIPWPLRQLLVRGVIIPKRYRESASFYRKIWTEEGSPLSVYGNSVKKLLQEKLGEEFHVELAMRYQNPSIASGLEKLKDYSQIIILPLFPQYASATTGSIYQKVMEITKSWLTIPEISFINSFPTHPKMIEAFCSRAQEKSIDSYDHLLFSFHGLPERQLIKADKNDYCLKAKNCCKKICEKNRSCYAAQCHATARAIAEKLSIKEENYSITFQSRLGKEPWIEPFTSDKLMELVKIDKKNVLVMCPAFICDCIETIHEISIEYKEEFIEAGGTTLDLVQGLNDHPLWIEALKELIVSRTLTQISC
ncbi:MAG: ferrochelatase [Chlamydiota bacterium]|nr:ferrochelatase [Chlamydiota bacterium]